MPNYMFKMTGFWKKKRKKIHSCIMIYHCDVVYKGNNRILRKKKLKFRIFFVKC
jgi:hypothetical protein